MCSYVESLFVGADTALHFACANGHASVAAFLLDNKAQINQLNAMGATALHVAAKGGHTRTLEVLIKYVTCPPPSSPSHRTTAVLTVSSVFPPPSSPSHRTTAVLTECVTQ